MKTFNFETDVINSISPVSEIVHIGLFEPLVAGPSIELAFPGITASIVYPSAYPNHIKNYVHWTSSSVSGGYYQTVFNNNKNENNSVALFDITYGASISSSYTTNIARQSGSVDEKIFVYKLFAKKILGDKNAIFNINGIQQHELIFITFKRNQYKDRIKPGSVKLHTVFTGSIATTAATGTPSEDLDDFFNRTVLLSDGVLNSWQGYQFASHQIGAIPFEINDVYSKFGALRFITQNIDGGGPDPVYPINKNVGYIYYDHGIIALVPELISITSSHVGNHWYVLQSASTDVKYSYSQIASSSNNLQLDDLINGCRQRILGIEFENESKMRSTFYICRAANDEFNYSSNPSYLNDQGRIIPTSGAIDLQSKTYITKIGLLGQNNELIAVASLRRPVRKTPDNEILIKVRLDY